MDSCQIRGRLLYTAWWILYSIISVLHFSTFLGGGTILSVFLFLLLLVHHRDVAIFSPVILGHPSWIHVIHSRQINWWGRLMYTATWWILYSPISILHLSPCTDLFNSHVYLHRSLRRLISGLHFFLLLAKHLSLFTLGFIWSGHGPSLCGVNPWGVGMEWGCVLAKFIPYGIPANCPILPGTVPFSVCPGSQKRIVPFFLFKKKERKKEKEKKNIVRKIWCNI